MDRIIGIIGYKDSGKDTIGDILIKYNFLKFAFADSLKKAASIIFNIPLVYFNDRELKDKPLGPHMYPHISPREIIKLLGTECVRSQFPTAWIMNVDSRIKNAGTDPEAFFEDDDYFGTDIKAVICDARFEDEIEYIRKRGGKIVRVYRPGTQQDGNHASEVYIDTVNPDFIIHNDSDLEHLGNQVKKMLGSFYG